MIGYQKRAWNPDKPVDFTGKMLEESFELYDLDKDPGEKNNLFKSQSKLAAGIWAGYLKEVENLKKRYRALHGKNSGTGLEVADDISPELLEILKQVGYLNDTQDKKTPETKKGK